jgi:3-phenylpropionate/trans-cinnamate dioxygenase ferredoxin subunit
VTDATTSGQWHRVARLNDLVEQEAYPVEVGNTFMALVKCGDRVHGISNICTHEFALLSDGIVEDGCIECPLHQARFDLATGERRSGPECEPLRIHATRIEPDGSVSVACD